MSVLAHYIRLSDINGRNSQIVLGVYLGVFKSQFTGKFLPVWFADVFLLLESSLQGLPLKV